MTSKVSPVLVTGDLAGEADGFRCWLLESGYSPLSAANQVRVLAHVSRWLAAGGLSPLELDTLRVEAFLAARRAAGYTCWLSPRGVRPLLTYLRSRGVVPPLVAVEPVMPGEALLVDYRRYLCEERGLAASTITHDLASAKAFLAWRSDSDGELRWASLRAADVAAFVAQECPRRSVGSAKLLVTGLRSLLRYLHLSGRIERPLTGAVPPVAGWRDGSLPRALPPGDVARLLSSCDRRRRVGRRDYAMLLLMLRLGLRAGEVAALSLDDLDWRAGEMVVRGKGRRDERLPLPADVGAAVAGYLRHARPVIADRAVFVTTRAPYRQVSSDAVKARVRYACARAGMTPFGAHRLRHTAASWMLWAGAGLPEIGQVLRHRALSTTAIYAKVDRDALRSLALPWPGSPR
jgi:integrase/recombinase XerD